jgi:hypothetical protein
MGRPNNLESCHIRFLPDGYLVTAFGEATVEPLEDGGLLVSVPVAYYDEEWEWLEGGWVHVGAEPQAAVVEEALYWYASLTGVPARP